MKRLTTRRVRVFGGLVTLSVGVIATTSCISLGSTPGGARLKRMKASRGWDLEAGRFRNDQRIVEEPMAKMITKSLGNTEHAVPSSAPPTVSLTAAELGSAGDELRVTWLGHSTALIDLEGVRVLIDPVWSERVSPLACVGPSRFHPPPLPLSELEKLAVDAVVISHDHYDHLDHQTIVQLRDRVQQFIVPLGVGAHLELWGVPPEKVLECGWWESAKVGTVRVTATPARHFSGRGLRRNPTLWSGWALVGSKQRVYYSGDTGMFPGFAEIGERLGPFDLTLIEVGAYDELWQDVHLGPEQAVEAHRLVRGRTMIPVHWGTFNLANHSWVEPIERVLAAARVAGVRVRSPRLGGSVTASSPPTQPWWPDLPWKSAEESPIRSSGT